MPEPRGGHRSQRTCIGCGERAEKNTFIRLVVRDGELAISPQGTGRGGYLHWRAECWEGLTRKRNLHRTFRVPVERAARERLARRLAEQD
jgi:predicted RNA-binding protein YlxR (DUF448 family)